MKTFLSNLIEDWWRVPVWGVLIATLVNSCGPAYAAGLTPRSVYDLVSPSMFELKLNGKFICTATKIAPRKLLTARHCVDHEGKYTATHDHTTYWAASITKASQDVVGRNGREDWAIITLATGSSDIPSVPLSCVEKPYVGQAVAYLGNPHPLKEVLGVGIVSSLAKRTNLTGEYARPVWDITTDIIVAAGASGSALISMDTGMIIGVLIVTIEIKGRGGYVIASGAQSIAGLDQCEDAER